MELTKEQVDVLLQIINQSNFPGHSLELIVEIKKTLKEAVASGN